MSHSNPRKMPSVLLVEDSAATAAKVKSFLGFEEASPFNLINARSLAEALAVIAAERLDVILLDLGLPDSFGLETFIRIKAAANHIPTVIFTGVDDEETAVEAVRLGAQDYLIKGAVDGRLLSRSIRYAIERKQIEEALREKTTQLIQTEKLSALGELTAGIVHEINQPLNAMKIACEDILLDIKKNRVNLSDVKENLDGVIREIVKIAELVDNLTLFARKTTGDRIEVFEASVPVERVLKLLDRQLSLHKINVKRELAEDLFISGDPVRMQQVFLNLINNAVNALELKDETEELNITVRLFRDMETGDDSRPIIYEICDNGVGVPAEMQEKIFEPFFSTRDSGDGTGLGLSIVTQIVQEHDGKITLTSDEGGETIFRIALPASQGRKRRRSRRPSLGF